MLSTTHILIILIIITVSSGQPWYPSDPNLVAKALQRSLDDSLHGVMDDIVFRHIIAKQRQQRTQQIISRSSQYSEYINLDGKDIYSLKGIIFPEHIISISLRNNRISNLIGCRFPIKLQSLMMDSNNINTLRPGDLPESLVHLNLQNNHISNDDFVHFTFPTNLKTLDISGNNISSIPFGVIPNHIAELFIGNNPLEDINAISVLTNLQMLNMKHCGLRLEMLQKITFPKEMQSIELSGNLLSSFRGITFPQKLNALWLDDMGITGEMLESLVLPKELLILSLENNLITDLSAFSVTKKLSQLALYGNHDLDLMTIPKDLQVSTLIIGFGQLEKVIIADRQVVIDALQYVVVRIDGGIENLRDLSIGELFAMGDSLQKYFRSLIRGLQVRVAMNAYNGGLSYITV